MTKLRIATWNLNWATGQRARDAGAVLRDSGGADILLAQEAHPDSLEDFCREAGLSWSHSAARAFPELIEQRGRVKGRPVAIAGRGTAPSTIEPVPDLEFVEKAAHAAVSHADTTMTVASYHAPAGVTHGIGKPRQAVRFADWLTTREGPAIMAGDFNTPEVDHPEDTKVRTHWHTGRAKLEDEPGDDVLVGPSPRHTLSDAYRSWLAEHPEELAAIRAKRPDGPLEVTIYTGKNRTRPGTPRRYDAIWLSPHFHVLAVDHLYNEAEAARIDHALVVATVEVRS